MSSLKLIPLKMSKDTKNVFGPQLTLCTHMGQFLQGGKNGRLMSYFFYRTRVRSLAMLVSDSLPHSPTDSVTFSRLD